MSLTILHFAIKQFEYYKSLGEKTIGQVPDPVLFWQYNTESNSIATIIKHLHGNMISRWTAFLTSDGEKPWRKREAEFDNDLKSRQEVLQLWDEGWACAMLTIKSLSSDDLLKEVLIRNESLTVMDAVLRQLAHYPYHIGQIVFIGKMAQNESWHSLSIPRGGTAKFNADKFDNPK